MIAVSVVLTAVLAAAAVAFFLAEWIAVNLVGRGASRPSLHRSPARDPRSSSSFGEGRRARNHDKYAARANGVQE